MSDKKVLMDLGNVRIKEYDSLNVVVERYEDVFVPKDKKTVKKWVFKGYSRNILSAMLYIQATELLIDRNKVNDLETHLKQVEQSNAELMEVMRE
ncbi:hypothetical protein [Sediminibacillus sp. JSM 1682029]|uniref:hypothetical protein n=1 Tax=Sediminibacillus sp. JSM 1682029 TaxID=3229857 RepID=UPI0035250286